MGILQHLIAHLLFRSSSGGFALRILLCALCAGLCGFAPAAIAASTATTFRASPTSPAGHETYTFRTAHYEITTDLPRDQARRIGRHMDRVYAEYERRFRGFTFRGPRQSPLHIYADGDAYLAFLASEGVNGAGTAGVFYHRGMKSGLAAQAAMGEQQMLETLQHEGFHQFAHMRIGETIPVWANEGLAEYFGRMMDLRGRFLTGLVDERTLRFVQMAIEARRHIPFEELLSMTGAEWNGRVAAGSAGLQYAQSWLVVHFLINAKNGRYAGMFLEYLKGMSRGMRHVEAFRAAFGTDDIASFETAWLEYVRDLAPDSVTTGAARAEFLGAGLLYLHQRGVTPASIDELKAELRARHFTVKASGHAGGPELTAADDEWFEPPVPERPNPRQAPEFILIPPEVGDGAEAPDLPPGIELRGLRATITVTFQRDEVGRISTHTEIK